MIQRLKQQLGQRWFSLLVIWIFVVGTIAILSMVLPDADLRDVIETVPTPSIP